MTPSYKLKVNGIHPYNSYFVVAQIEGIEYRMYDTFEPPDGVMLYTSLYFLLW